MWRVTNRVPIASIARPDDAILSFELPMAMTGLGSLPVIEGSRDVGFPLIAEIQTPHFLSGCAIVAES